MRQPRLTLSTLGLALSTALASLTTLAAPGILVEERGLNSKPPVQLRAPAAVEAIDSQPLDSAEARDGNQAQGSSWEIFQQIQQLQEEVRNLRGTVEEQGHLLERMRNDQRSRYTDLDQRLNTLNERISQQAASTPAASPAAPVEAPAATAVVNIEEEKKAYLAAYETFRAQGPDKAIPPMLAFVGRYPGSTFAPNAHYWLGEFYLAASRPNPEQAQRQFETVLSKFPDNAKAAAALYKLGSIADLQNKPDEARRRMQEVLSRYPNSPEAALANSFLKTAAKPTTPSKPAPPAKPAPKSKP